MKIIGIEIARRYCWPKSGRRSWSETGNDEVDGRRTSAFRFKPRNDVDTDTLQGLGDHTTMNHDQWPGEIWGLMIDPLTLSFLGLWMATSRIKQELSEENHAHHERREEGARC